MRLLLKNNEATLKLGQALAQSIDDRAVIALSGPLGAGKTTLVKAVAQGLGVTEVVTSPTFTMLNEYHSGRLPLYHMDLYRLSEGKTPAPLDLLIAELEEFLETPMVAMFEWAELFPDVNEPPDSGVSPADKSLGYLSQLDHLVVKLDYGSPQKPHSMGCLARLNRIKMIWLRKTVLIRMKISESPIWQHMDGSRLRY